MTTTRRGRRPNRDFIASSFRSRRHYSARSARSRGGKDPPAPCVSSGMRISKATLTVLFVTASLARAAISSLPALGDRGGHGHGHGGLLLRTTLAPSVPQDHDLHGVKAGAAPWVLKRGDARLQRDGRLQVRIRGLVIPSPTLDGTPGPVQRVNAALYCGDDTAAADTTASVPISRQGDARIDETLTLPAKCLGPVLLIHPHDNSGLYIAASGTQS